jgi:hypothetical protein
MSLPLTENMVVHILERERQPIRFEELCIATLSDLDQIDYVSTSRTYDLNRDGRGANIWSGKMPPFVCCSTIEHKKVVGKATSDFEGLIEKVASGVPENIVFCFSDPQFTENTSAQIDQAVRKICPTIQSVRSFGAEQLSQIIKKYGMSQGMLKLTLAS